MDNYSFENLKAYKLSRILVVEVYKIVNSLPACERYELGSQIRRAIVSVVSNLAEGSGRISYKEKNHFIEISYGSLMETYCQLQICLDLHYIKEETFLKIRPYFFEISRLLNALRTSFLKKLSNPDKP